MLHGHEDQALSRYEAQIKLPDSLVMMFASFDRLPEFLLQISMSFEFRLERTPHIQTSMMLRIYADTSPVLSHFCLPRNR